MRSGAFVRVLFPTHEKPRQPGLPHIGYVPGVDDRYALVAYTTSQRWPTDLPLPAGARVFSAAEAAQLNQSRDFVLRLDVLARLPLNLAWFPDLGSDRGDIIAVAPLALKRELRAIAENLARRKRVLIQMRGP